MGIKNYKLIVLLPFSVFFFLLTWTVSGNAFFWDTINLASRNALWFYDQHFNSILLPENMDTGHPPIFAMYLALCWKFFGKSLEVSHWAMFPFLLGIVWQSYGIINHYFDKKYLPWVLTLFLADPTLLSQATLVSPDIVLVFAFLAAINSLLSKQKILLSTVLTLLALISMRGMMACVVIFIFDVLRQYLEEKKSIKLMLSNCLFYLPGALAGASFLWIHYRSAGWIGYHPASPWAPSFEKVNFNGILFNILVLGWRLLDFGKIFIWILSITLAAKWILNKQVIDNKLKQLSLLFFISLLILSASMLLHKGLMGHRYLLPVFLIFALLSAYLLLKSNLSENLKKLCFGLLIVGLLSGNLWSYPQGIAMGWDSTLAHQPYYHLKNELKIYLAEKKINSTEVGSSFPNITPNYITDLDNDSTSFHEKNFRKDRYIVYSNVFNDFSNDEFMELKNNWLLLKSFKRGAVEIRLYQKNDK